MKAADYGTQTEAASAFVSTNSICQGQQVPIHWPLVLGTGHQIAFAHTSFKWANLASYNAGVIVAIISISIEPNNIKNCYRCPTMAIRSYSRSPILIRTWWLDKKFLFTHGDRHYLGDTR